MATEDSDERYVCHDCIGDQFLADEVRGSGTDAHCFHCGDSRVAWSLVDLASRIAEVLRDHFNLSTDDYQYGITESGSFDWITTGDVIDEAIGEIAGIDLDIASAVVEYLNESTRRDVIKYGATNFYDTEAYYEEREAEDQGFHHTWRAFCDEIKSRARFFSVTAEDMLDDIFGNLDSLETRGGETVVRHVDSNVEDRSVWRARKAESQEELKGILKAPASEIGPPPTEYAGDGRMNAKGISVFYGAFDQATCVAEIRPPVGSYVAMGRFELVRDVRLLDMDLLANVHDWGSHFDPDYAEHKARAAFLKFLVDEISRPILPGDEAFEYLPTQAVAEYLANRVNPRLDGIIFRSSQTGSAGRNLVLFNHASFVDQSGIACESDKEITDISIPSGDWDERDDTIFIREKEASPSSGDTAPELESSVDVPSMPGIALENSQSPQINSGAAPTLKLDSESVTVSRISAVKYAEEQFNIIRAEMSDEPLRQF